MDTADMDTAADVKVKEVAEKAMDLPVLPATAQKVLSIMSDPDVSIEKIKRIISSDPGLTTKILKVANSAFYGGYRNIQNLTQGILRLGLNSVRNIVVATSMKNVYKRFGLAEKLLWEQMIGSALASSIIAKKTRATDAEDAFIGGLLHDVGKVVLNNEFPEDFAKVMARVYNESISYSEAEAGVFDFSQRKVGASLVKKWGFPESIEMLLLHFDDHEKVVEDRALYNLVTVITMSDRMCQKFGTGWRKAYGDEVDFGNLPEVLGFDEVGLGEIFEEIQDVFKEEVHNY
jgi:HD-like signal output (HDOD) protein